MSKTFILFADDANVFSCEKLRCTVQKFVFERKADFLSSEWSEVL